MKKTVTTVALIVMLAVLCSSAVAESSAGKYEAVLKGTWVCVNSAQSPVTVFSYPSSDVVMTGSDNGAIYLTYIDDEELVYFWGEATFSKDGKTLVILSAANPYPTVYQKEDDPYSPVGEWVADVSSDSTAVFCFYEDGTCLASYYVEGELVETTDDIGIDIGWELGDGVIIMEIDQDGMETIMLPYDGDTIDLSPMGEDVFAVRKE